MASLGRMSTWFDLLKPFTIESVRVDMPPSFAEECRRFFFKLYDTTFPYAVKVAKTVLQRHPELREALERAIGRWGAVFVRTDVASPKDACVELAYFEEDLAEYGIFHVPGTSYNACLATKPEAAVALLLRSERVAVMGGLETLWLRKPFLPRHEAGFFVEGGEIRAVSQYYPDQSVDPAKFLACVRWYAKTLEHIIRIVEEHLGIQSFTADMAVASGRALLVELSPPISSGVTSGIFFKNAEDTLSKNNNDQNTIRVRFRKLGGIAEVSVNNIEEIEIAFQLPRPSE